MKIAKIHFLKYRVFFLPIIDIGRSAEALGEDIRHLDLEGRPGGSSNGADTFGEHQSHR